MSFGSNKETATLILSKFLKQVNYIKKITEIGLYN